MAPVICMMYPLQSSAPKSLSSRLIYMMEQCGQRLARSRERRRSGANLDRVPFAHASRPRASFDRLGSRNPVVLVHG